MKRGKDKPTVKLRAGIITYATAKELARVSKLLATSDLDVFFYFTYIPVLCNAAKKRLQVSKFLNTVKNCATMQHDGAFSIQISLRKHTYRLQDTRVATDLVPEIPKKVLIRAYVHVIAHRLSTVPRRSFLSFRPIVPRN